MKVLSDIKERIEEIRNSDFKIGEFELFNKKHKVTNLLRSALICNNYIGDIYGISLEEESKLYQELDEVMKDKLRKLNPNFSEKTLNNMINAYKRDYIIYPMDIFVVDDAVFHKEGVFDDFGNIYKIKTFMFKDMKPYYDISDMYFTLDDFDFCPTEKKEQLTKEDEIYTSKFIIDSIKSIWKASMTSLIYELDMCGISVCINMKFNDIVRSLKEKIECDIKFCIQNGDDIKLYYVHQSFKDNDPVWSVVKINHDVWRLTEEVLKLENKCANATYQLTQRKKSDLLQ